MKLDEKIFKANRRLELLNEKLFIFKDNGGLLINVGGTIYDTHYYATSDLSIKWLLQAAFKAKDNLKRGITCGI